MSEDSDKASGAPRLAKNKRWRMTLMIAAPVCLYVLSFFVWSRCLPGKSGLENGRNWYSFVAADPDWEHTIYYFYLPLVKLDGLVGERHHKFTVVYL